MSKAALNLQSPALMQRLANTPLVQNIQKEIRAEEEVGRQRALALLAKLTSEYSERTRIEGPKLELEWKKMEQRKAQLQADEEDLRHRGGVFEIENERSRDAIRAARASLETSMPAVAAVLRDLRLAGNTLYAGGETDAAEQLGQLAERVRRALHDPRADVFKVIDQVESEFASVRGRLGL